MNNLFTVWLISVEAISIDKPILQVSEKEYDEVLNGKQVTRLKLFVLIIMFKIAILDEAKFEIFNAYFLISSGR